ncbi:quorum-sensing-regulated virulence factor family protein [Pseudomonas sp. NPDC078700]|uniref:quorum-sensing-regulated virulence factor family protein n=1 Tax=Pseudomonas sp. NPDC078700 TaxID=3364424 RepID=UPI0037CA0D45
MLRLTALTLALSLPFAAHASSLKDYELTKMLQSVAQESSVGTPRAINADILDQGYTVEGHTLINHLSVQPRHAAQMRNNLDAVRAQLGKSVCNNGGFHKLLSEGAELRYEFTEYKTNRPVVRETFDKGDCGQ